MQTRRAWLIRPPKNGHHDDYAIESGIVTGDFGVRGDLSDHIEQEQVLEEVELANPGLRTGKIESMARQLFTLLHEMSAGDLIIHPHQGRTRIAIGILLPEVVSDRDGHPAREVEWLRTDVPKGELHADLHHSLASGLQVCELSRNNALERIEVIVADGRDPGPFMSSGKSGKSLDNMSATEIETHLRNGFTAHVGSVFAGHDMARLAAALLEAEGYKVHVSPPGPDGGCDLLAGRGTLGFDGPTIAGQVKSGDIVVDDLVFQSLTGVIQSRGADRGLIVSWAGVTRPVAKEIERYPFKYAIWDKQDICEKLVDHYDALPLWIRDRIRIRKVPVLDIQTKSGV
jgi:restriction system protein